ncbi:MobF family relaxase [Nitrobacter sp.]|uniref:MobF family relaxase n=1 Tax=Nitrobacter sp. TaxID=29420 RepID=UPI001D4ED0BA|nr:MobF family relaxase [Nitrobacter sp.]MCB1394377.1 relaxase domain-containing protein [Nitrobacter sp.]
MVSSLETIAVVATWNVAASSAYYVRGAEYYLGEREPDGVWYAPSGDLGRRDATTVQPKEFVRLYEGLGENGQSLITNAGGKANQRVPAFDLTFSAPRSVSLAWAFADEDLRRSLETAQARAVRSTLATVEKEAIFARRGRDGMRVERVALTAALFQHGESRPAEHADGRIFGDPNLHTHAVVLNMATRADGTVGALHSTVLRDWKMAAGAVYHAALANEMADLGFDIDRVGKNGTFELTGVSDKAITYFSARRHEIEKELAEAGTTSGSSAALASTVARSTRHAKERDTDRETVWREAAPAAGLDGEIGAAIQQRPAQRFVATNAERVLAERLAALPAQLTEHESVIDRRDLVRSVHAASVGLGMLSRLDREVDQLVSSGAFVEIGRDAIGQARYSTPEMIAIERDLVATASRLADRRGAGIDPTDIKARSVTHGLSAEQTFAAEAATGPNAIVVIEGAPGSGKTTTLAPIVDAWQAAGHRVIGTATAWRVARALQHDLNIEARATASWVERLRTGERFLDEKSVLIVDEAGLLSSREMQALLSEVERAQARAILVGDRRQLQAIGAGPGLDLVVRSVEATRVDTIVRQRDAWARQAVTDFGAGRARQALDAFQIHGCLDESPSYRAALQRTVELWNQARAEHPDSSVLLIARTNKQVADISRAVRAELKREGVIQGGEAGIEAVTPSGQAARLEIARGDRIRFQLRNDRLGVVNGTLATVIAVHTDPSQEPNTPGNIRIEAVIDKRRISFVPTEVADERGRARLGWAYASTVHGSQGMTVDRAVVLLDPQFDRHAVHVAASRARDETRLVVDRSQIDALMSSRLPLDRARQAEAASAEERRALLAGRLSTGRAKTSTIAVIGQAALPAKQADRSLNRQAVDHPTRPPSRSPAAQETVRSVPRSGTRDRSRELDYGR